MADEVMFVEVAVTAEVSVVEGLVMSAVSLLGQMVQSWTPGLAGPVGLH